MLARAAQVAEDVVAELAPSCEQIEIAGSIRRRVDWVKDIEIVAIPKVRVDLFGEPMDEPSALDLEVERLIVAKRLEPREPRRMGRRYKSLRVVRSQLPLDLFIVQPPAQWGAIFAIRTGPAEYSQHLVTACQKRGLRCTQGHLETLAGRTVETPTEHGFIVACGLEPVPPERRE